VLLMAPPLIVNKDEADQILETVTGAMHRAL
jgi:adenosylmethionine-8-amino-7-oxononanoate aminotransferase